MNDTRAPSRSWAQAAAAGTGVWVVGAALLDVDRIEALLALGPLVLVPLGLRLVAPVGPSGLPGAWRVLPAFAPVSAALLMMGMALRPGAWPALLAIPWLTCGLLVGLGGAARAVGRLRARGDGDLVAGLVIDAGLVFLPVGAGWTALSAAGIRPLGFAEPIVLLTGVHFHYSGFVMAVLAGWLARRRAGKAAPAVAAGVVVGVPLVAVGITLGGTAGWLVAELAAAGVLGFVGVTLGILQAQTALAGAAGGGPPSAVARALLGLSGLALIAGMALAVAYPLGRVLEAAWLDIPTMAATHGVLNAVGFGLLGLLAWTLRS